MKRLMIIPAAGRGSRLGNTGSKVLAEVGGRPMLDYLLELYHPYVERFVVIVPPAFADEVAEHCSGRGSAIELAVQKEPTGMLDAILIPLDRVRELAPLKVWITWCDQVAIRPETVSRMARTELEGPDAAVVLPTIVRPNPYVHFVRDADGQIEAILHRREGDEMPAVGEADLGLFGLAIRTYLEDLPRFAHEVRRGLGTGERNFLPFLGWLRGGASIRSFEGTDVVESVGVNTPEDRATVEEFLRRA